MSSRFAKARGSLSASAAVATARMFSLVAAAVQLPFLARMLDPGEFAFVAVAIAWAAYFSLCSAEATTLAFQRFPGSSLARANFRFARRSLLRGLVAVSALVLIVSVLLGHLDFGVALVGFGIGMAVNRFVATAWLMWSAPWSYAGCLMLGTGARVVVLLGMLTVGASPYLAVGLAGVASAVASLLFSPRTGGSGRLSDPPWPRSLGISLALGSAAYAVLTNFNLLALPHVVPDLAVARFAAMSQASTLSLGALLGVAMVVLQPQTLNLWNAGEERAATALISTACHGTLLLGALTVVAVELGGRQALSAALGPVYFNREILHLMVAATTVAALGQFIAMSQVLHLRSSKVRDSTAVAAVVGSTASLTGALLVGVEGASAGMLLGFLVYLAAMWIQSGTDWQVLALGSSAAAIAVSTLRFEGGPAVLILALAQVVLAGVLGVTSWTSFRRTHA